MVISSTVSAISFPWVTLSLYAFESLFESCPKKHNTYSDKIEFSERLAHLGSTWGSSEELFFLSIKNQ
jgi:hypothetical protein